MLRWFATLLGLEPVNNPPQDTMSRNRELDPQRWPDGPQIRKVVQNQQPEHWGHSEWSWHSNGYLARPGSVGPKLDKAECRRCLGVLQCQACEGLVRPNTGTNDMRAQLARGCSNIGCGRALVQIPCKARTCSFVWEENGVRYAIWEHIGSHSSHPRPPVGRKLPHSRRAQDARVVINPPLALAATVKVRGKSTQKEKVLDVSDSDGEEEGVTPKRPRGGAGRRRRIVVSSDESDNNDEPMPISDHPAAHKSPCCSRQVQDTAMGPSDAPAESLTLADGPARSSLSRQTTPALAHPQTTLADTRLSGDGSEPHVRSHKLRAIYVQRENSPTPSQVQSHQLPVPSHPREKRKLRFDLGRVIDCVGCGTAGDGSELDREEIQCSICQKWSHSACMQESLELSACGEDGIWSCPLCRGIEVWADAK